MDKYIINLDDYKKIKKIGEGAYAKVYLVENIKTEKLYAAKVNKFELEEGESEKASQLNEVFTLINLNHPTILKIYGYCLHNFKNDPCLTIILEYMPNGTLHNILEERRKRKQIHDGWTNTKAYINLLGVGIGMKYLFSKNIVQRDLKPLNILLDYNFYPCISDFGFSKELTSMVSANLMKSGVGSLAYMAPEILSNQPYTYKVDVFSYAILAYELITSKSPIGNCRTPNGFIRNVIKGTRPDVSMIEDDDIRDFLQICWSSNPSDRPTFPEIVEILEEKWFYSKFDVDEEEIKEYLKRFEGESLKDVGKPNSEVHKKSSKKLKLTKKEPNDSNEQDEQDDSILDTNPTSSLESCSKLLDEMTIQIINESVNEVFNQPIFPLKTIKDIKYSQDSLLTPKNIQEAIHKKPYEDFIPTISFQLDKPLKNIDYNKLQDVLGKNVVIVNVESYRTNLQNGFISVEDFEPFAENTPTSLRIALLLFDFFESNIKSELDQYVAELLGKLKENQASLGNIVGTPTIRIPSDEDIKSVYLRPSINGSADFDEIEMNQVRQKVIEKLRDEKKMYNWEFVFKHEDLYRQMNQQIRKDLETNQHEIVMVNQTIFPTTLLKEYENIQIPEGQAHECFLYSGSLIKSNGFLATDNPFLAAMYSNGSKILAVNEKAQIVCCRCIYNKSAVKNLNGKPITDDIKNNYGISLSKHIPIDPSEKNAINAKEYVFPNKVQLIPICSFTVMRRDHYILWRDNNLINPLNFKNDEAVGLKKFYRDLEINIYIKYNNKDALQIIQNKQFIPVKLITNGGADKSGESLIKQARSIIGSKFVCLVFANSLGHMKWISSMENVLYANKPEFFWKFVMVNMNTIDILSFESELRNFYEAIFKEKNLDFWNINKGELLRFPDHKQPPSPKPCNLA